MYTYEWDSTTGGYLLQTTPSIFSKEPRPVYYKELDILGLDKYWNYAKDDSKPYMWAEASSYYYRGMLVAKTKGGSLYTAPEIQLFDKPEQDGSELRFVDIDLMVERNKTIMDALVNETIKKLYNTYMEYKDKINVFYVAFSGGKDSIALLDIVQKTLPHNEFMVLFGNTEMENEDTYTLVDEIEQECNSNGIDFYRSKSHLDIAKSWMTFGYPSAKLRWCCCVHKTTPQIIFLRDKLGKSDFTGMAFVGIRKDESSTRSKYETISEGEKHQGQYSFNVIDEWNSAELYLYTYGNQLHINEGYKKGNSRVGCLVCPMSTGKHEYLKRVNYKKDVDFFISLIKDKSSRQFDDINKEREFIENGGWKVRNNGRDINEPTVKYEEYMENFDLHIIVNKNKSWKEWSKTIGELSSNNNDLFNLTFSGKIYQFKVTEREFNLEFILDGKPHTKQDIQFLSLFRSVLKKSAYCIGCKACIANCQNGCITMEPQVKISPNCKHCLKCHKVDSGCLVYNSVKVLKGVEKKMSLDSYASFGVEKEWVTKYLSYKEGFWKSEYNDLGSMKITALKRFLRDAKIKLEIGESDAYAIELNRIFCENNTSEEVFWALLMTNLAYAPQLNWFIKNTNIGERYLPDEIKMKLGEGTSKGTNNNIVSSLKNIFTRTPLGTALGIGACETDRKGSKIISITRGSWFNPDARVILYALYKFAEACGDYYQFTLTRLMNYNIDSDGVSPSMIFGIDRETMEKLLNGLSINYPKFISVSFTLDLDNITLRNDKTSKDVLELF